jgi:hypothetical protein
MISIKFANEIAEAIEAEEGGILRKAALLYLQEKIAEYEDPNFLDHLGQANNFIRKLIQIEIQGRRGY